MQAESQEKQSDNLQGEGKRRKQHPLELRIIAITVAMIIIAFGSAAIWIWVRQGITTITLSLISLVIAVMIGLPGLMFAYFQWRYPIHHNEPKHTDIPAQSIPLQPLSNNQQDPPQDFFISYNSTDRLWAEWIAWQLRQEGYTVVTRIWDYRPDRNFALEMDKAAKQAKCIMIILSTNYLNTLYTQPEWVNAFRRDSKDNSVILLPVYVDKSELEGIVEPIVGIDVVGLDEQKARETLLAGVHYETRKLADMPSSPTEIGNLEVERPRFPGTFPKTWNIPYLRNPFFTNREDDLKLLHEALRGDKAAALTQPPAISGLGGIGKTQTAVEYAYRHYDEYQTVLWSKADSREALISDFVNIAGLLNLPEKDVQDQKIVVNAVKRWLQDHASWLLIFDNTNDLTIVKDFIPPTDKGHTMLTTRIQATGAMAKCIEIGKLDLEEGALFLLRRANIIAPNAQLNDANDIDLVKAKEISEILDGLPLALDQAGAYIEETKCSLSDYLEFYRTRRMVLLNLRGGTAFDHPDSVTTTLSLSFEKVEQASLAAAELLRLCAFLYPDAIPDEIITEGAADLGSILQPIAADSFKLNTTIKEILKYSLIRRDSSAKTLTIHRLVQAVLKDDMDKETQHLWAERTVQAVNRAFPDVEFATWQKCQRCLPHAQTCAQLIEQWEIVSTEAARLLDHAGRYLEERAQYNQAEPLLTKALAIRKKILGPDHLDVASTLNSLGLLYYNQGKYKEAASLYQKALTIRERALGSGHPDVATTLNNLGLLYYNQGKYSEAQQYLERALTIREKTLGREHPDSLNNLALLYYNQGKYSEAEPLYQQALAIHKKNLGFEHPDVATILNNLGLLYYNQGKYSEAEPLYRQALIIREKSLGPEHPEVASTLNNLAWLYYNQGKYTQIEQLYYNQCEYTQVEQLYLQAKAIREKVLGSEHPDVAQSLNALAILYRTQGKYSEAEQLFNQALSIREQSLGLEHPYVATTLNDWAWLCRTQGKYTQAEQLYQRALIIREKTLGPEHPHVATTLNDLAVLYVDQGKYTQAEQLYLKAKEIREASLGPEHPRLATTLNNLASLYYLEGKYEQAEQLYKSAMEIRQKSLGPEHPHMAQSFNDLADVYRSQKKYAQAEDLYEKALKLRINALGPKHQHVATNLNNLAKLYFEQGKYTQAEDLYLQALDIREKVLGSEHPYVAQSLNNLAKLYANQGKYIEAELLYKRALAIYEQALESDHPLIATVLENYMFLLRRTNREPTAAELEARITLIRAKHAQENIPK